MAVLEDDMAREAIKSSCSDLTYGLATESGLEGFGLSLMASMNDNFLDLVFFLLDPAPNPFEAASDPQAVGLDRRTNPSVLTTSVAATRTDNIESEDRMVGGDVLKSVVGDPTLMKGVSCER